MEDLNEGNVGVDDERTEDSGHEGSGQRSSPVVSMEVEEESRERPSFESDSLSKRELFKIIEDQDKAIAMLQRELDGGRSADAREYSPPVRKRDMLMDDSDVSEYGRPYYEGPHAEVTPPRRPGVWRAPGELVGLGPEEQNPWTPRRQTRRFGIRQPLAQSVLMEPA
ncbi:unnamed protein product [Linum trigynum]|uniref:Uncharacterized protein n=1 Tax=Linum trigynum TaxID=586398 RepID=A0AAV2DDS8_9ROSI